jgi:transcriptional regulator of aromatic amino acid metabolism
MVGTVRFPPTITGTRSCAAGDTGREYNFGDIIGQSTAISYVFFRIEQVAPQDATVLLLGETGTGKGMVARAIHGPRSSRPSRAPSRPVAGHSSLRPRGTAVTAAAIRPAAAMP